jgi:hypothetical protein
MLCCNPTLRKCEDEAHTLEMGTWESFGTLEILEFDCNGQNTSHWGVFYNIKKLQKCRLFGNRPDPDVCKRSVTHRWKALDESYNFASNLVPIEVWAKSYNLTKLQESKPWQFQDKKSFGCGCHWEAQRILYGGRWWLLLSPGHGESCESRVAHGLS